MPVFAIVVGLIMELIGFLAFFTSETRSFTALIPAVFGTILILCGIVSLAFPGARKHAMHAAAAVSLLGLLAVLGRSGGQIPALLAGEPVTPSVAALWYQLTFAFFCFLFVVACVRSFVQARLAAKTNPANSEPPQPQP